MFVLCTLESPMQPSKYLWLITQTHSPLTRDRQLSKMSPGFPFPQQSGTLTQAHVVHSWQSNTSTRMNTNNHSDMEEETYMLVEISLLDDETPATWFRRTAFTERDSFIRKITVEKVSFSEK